MSIRMSYFRPDCLNHATKVATCLRCPLCSQSLGGHRIFRRKPQNKRVVAKEKAVGRIDLDWQQPQERFAVRSLQKRSFA